MVSLLAFSITIPKSQILIVEDNADTRRGLSRLLNRWGFEVSTAKSVETGRALVNAKRFDALFCDIGLPDGSGYTLVAEAKQKQSKLKAIAISGRFNSATDVELGRLSGFDSYLPKPFDSHLLRAALPKVRSGRGGQQAARRKSAKKS